MECLSILRDTLEEGVKGIQWVERDYENQKCKFIFLRDEDE